MQIDALLCDHAQVSGGKLFVSGAGIDRMYVGPAAPYVVSFAVAGTVTVPPAEAPGEHRLLLRLVTADGRPAPLLGEAAGREVGGELGLVGSDEEAGHDQVIAFAFTFQGVPLAELGDYALVCSLDGTEVRRIAARVERAPQA
jgi:hypothetical protein